MLGSYLLTAATAASSLTQVMAGAIRRQSQTLPKANEYQSSDCSGDLNYGHRSPLLYEVTMDDTTHSVYLALPPPGPTAADKWVAFSGKSKNGGVCTGEMLGILGGECQNLDTVYSKRVNCVRKCGVFPDGTEYDVGCFTPT